MKEINYWISLSRVIPPAAKELFPAKECVFPQTSPDRQGFDCRQGAYPVQEVKADPCQHHHHHHHVPLVLGSLNEELHRRLLNHILIIQWASHLLSHITHFKYKLHVEVEGILAWISRTFWEALKKPQFYIIDQRHTGVQPVHVSSHKCWSPKDDNILFTASALATKF